MKNLIVGNWKMNPSTQKEAKEIFSALGGPALNWDAIDVVICPPFVYMSGMVRLPVQSFSEGGLPSRFNF